MTKMERTVKDISDLHDFYMKLVKAKEQLSIEFVRNGQKGMIFVVGNKKAEGSNTKTSNH